MCLIVTTACRTTEKQTAVQAIHPEPDHAGWQTPKHHPDLVPLAEAGRLENLLRILQTDPQTIDRPEDFKQMMTAAWRASQQLETALVDQAPQVVLSQRLGAVHEHCNACHAVYRNQH